MSPQHTPTLEQLEAHARTALEWPLLLEELAKRARSGCGQQRLRELAPEATVEKAHARMAKVRAILDLGEHGVELPLADFPDIREVLGRIGLGATVSGSELLDVLRVLERAAALRAVATEHAAERPELIELLSSDPRLDRVLQRLAQGLERDGTVSDRASAALAEARSRVREVREELKRRLGDLVQRYSDVMQSQYYTEREGRYVLPVRSDAHYRVEGIVFGSSSSGSTLFVEPREVTDLGNRLRVREAAVERETMRVLAELATLVRERLEAVHAAHEVCVDADAVAAIAQFAVETRAQPIDVSLDDRCELLAARHPLLVLCGHPVVANDMVISGGQALVISGPNAGGKTVTLKCLGLFAWMVRAGVPIPARPESHVGWFDHVLADIGDEQSLVLSLSTFSAHVENLAQILTLARPRVLVLLDEVAAGTDPEEGAALAAAVLEVLTAQGAAVAVTTHYERLKELAAEEGALKNASVGFDFANMSPTFRLTLGVPGASSALLVASRHGLPAAVLERAHQLLPRASLDRERIIQELERERTRAAEERQASENERKLAQERQAAFEQDRLRLEAELRSTIERDAQELAKEVRKARAELEQARTRLKAEHLERAELRLLESQVTDVARQIAIGGRLAPRARRVPQPGPMLDLSTLGPGARVRLRSTGAIGTVLERPSRGEVSLRVGAVRVRGKLEELEPAPPAAKISAPQKQRLRASLATTPRGYDRAHRTSDNTLDLRGVRVEDASDQVDVFVDRMLADGESVGFILHGHGTGALRSAVREHLTRSSHIEHVRAAEADEGGDAFTVFWLR